MLRVRQGGDEFVLVEVVSAVEQALARGDQVVELVRESVRTSPDRTVKVTASVGVVVTMPGERLDVEDLLLRADVAMFEAKRAGGNRCVYYENVSPTG